jgi:hypothetical protein
VTQESGAAFEGQVTPDGIRNVCDAMLMLSYDPNRGEEFEEQEKRHAQQREELKGVFEEQKNWDNLNTSSIISSNEPEVQAWPDIRKNYWSTALRRRRTVAYMLFHDPDNINEGILSPDRQKGLGDQKETTPEKLFFGIEKKSLFYRIHKEVNKL